MKELILKDFINSFEKRSNLGNVLDLNEHFTLTNKDNVTFFIDEKFLLFLLNKKIQKIIFPNLNDLKITIKGRISNKKELEKKFKNSIELVFSKNKYNLLSINFFYLNHNFFNIKKLFENLEYKEINHLKIDLGYKGIKKRVVLNLENINIKHSLNVSNIYEIKGTLKTKNLNFLEFSNILKIDDNLLSKIKYIKKLKIHNYEINGICIGNEDVDFDKNNYLNFIKNNKEKIEINHLYLNFEKTFASCCLNNINIKGLKTLTIKNLEIENDNIVIKDLDTFQSFDNNFKNLKILNCKTVLLYDIFATKLDVKNSKKIIINDSKIDNINIINSRNIILFDSNNKSLEINNFNKLEIFNSISHVGNIFAGREIDVFVNEYMLYTDDYTEVVKNLIKNIDIESVDNLVIQTQTIHLFDKVRLKNIDHLKLKMKYFYQYYELVTFFSFIQKYKNEIKNYHICFENDYNISNDNFKKNILKKSVDIYKLLEKLNFLTKRKYYNKAENIIKKEIMKNLKNILPYTLNEENLKLLLDKEDYKKITKKQKGIISSII